MKNPFLTLLFILACRGLLFADTLFLKSGKVFDCRIVEKTGDYVKIEYSGRPLYFEWKYVRKIDEHAAFHAEKGECREASAEQWSREIADEIRQGRSRGIKAVIAASALKGFSPLKVKFNGSGSSSADGKIISYRWDFGDGDTSRLARASNTYISMSYGVREYNVKLTVEDEKGNISFAETTVYVDNKDL
ncbi:MAG: PKD domain-containing protein [Candidatus Omnitrophica bacterium]|nr:PKD domain-containing protein [Candidatus Omnitrophota bacterium]MDD5500307.1 PKD domain-containing protein [Candidatus Omnitrophota bacterium]